MEKVLNNSANCGRFEEQITNIFYTDPFQQENKSPYKNTKLMQPFLLHAKIVCVTIVTKDLKCKVISKNALNRITKTYIY